MYVLAIISIPIKIQVGGSDSVIFNLNSTWGLSLVLGLFLFFFPSFSVHEIDVMSQHLGARSALNYVFFWGENSKPLLNSQKDL